MCGSLLEKVVLRVSGVTKVQRWPRKKSETGSRKELGGCWVCTSRPCVKGMEVAFLCFHSGFSWVPVPSCIVTIGNRGENKHIVLLFSPPPCKTPVQSVS